MLFKIKYIFVFVFISCNSNLENKTRLSLPAVFSDQMVLQQNTNVTFWGKSKPKENVQVIGNWGASSNVISDKNGNWEMKISTPKAGGPFMIEVKTQTEKLFYNDVLIGEVWLASGQSNMGMIMDTDGWGIDSCDGCLENQIEAIQNANNNEIRVFGVLEDLTGESFKKQKWVKTTPENTKRFSAVAYYFAKKLYDELDIPVGIITTSWGGTKVESWISNKKLKTLSPKNEVPLAESSPELEKERLEYNDSIAKINKSKNGYLTFDLPKPYFLWNEEIVWNVDIWDIYQDEWAKLDLNDLDFKNVNFDDSHWEKLLFSKQKRDNEIKTLKFNSIFNSNTNNLSSGVVWLRANFKVDDITQDYNLLVDKGIDHIDQTFFNGTMIGNTFSIDGKRNYKIPKSLLKNGDNILAVRVTNLGGDGGIMSPVILQNPLVTIKIPFTKFKIKHHAFITNGSSVLTHNFTFKELVQDYNEIEKSIIRGYDINTPYGNSISYEKMLKPVLPYSIKGAIWYQGESNVDNSFEYQELFTGMIEDWRESWGYDFSFYYVQIAPFEYAPYQESHKLRDAQRKTLKTTSKTGMAVIMDIGEEKDIHPHNKQDVGKRLALLALDKDYEFDIISSGPLYKSHKTFSNYIDIDFENKGSGLMSKGALKDFEVAGDNMIYKTAKAEIIDNKIRVSSNKVKYPKHVRYGWKNWTVGTLFNKEGMPASSFSSN